MAASTRWRLWRETAVIVAVLAQFANGYEESYSISQFSPKSVSHIDLADPVLKTSNAENLAFRLEPSAFEDGTDPEDLGHVKHEDHIIVERSADPTRDIRSINVDDIPSSNNEIDSDIELHNRRKYYDIHPTKTVDYLHSNDEVVLSSFGDRLEFRFPGEGRRVPFGRALPMGPRVRPTAVQPIFATATPREEGRQNSEIQNIITGIVKLLNGNVNVQANSQLLNGRPRPMNSRINNRGPPRISDVPPLPDFDKPVTPPHSFVPTKIPPPYPFDRPPVHVNLPEQIVPPLVSRPSLHRPIPPWQRPRPRPPNRRPNPGLPMYKPNVPIILQEPEVSEEIPDEYLVNENENHSENGIHHEDAVLHEDAVHHEEPVHEVNTPEEPTLEVETEAQTERETTTAEVTTEVSTTTSTTEPPTTTEKTTTTEATTTTKATTKPTTTKPTTEKPKTEKIKPEKEKKKETPVTDKKDKFKIDDKPKVDNKTVSNVTTTTSENPIKNDTVPIIESSIAEMSTASSTITPTPTEGLVTHVSADPTTAQIESTTINSQPLPSSQTIPYHPYRPRPGIVLDDPDFKPKGTRYRPEAAVITAPADLPPAYGEIFDVTVSAVQGPGEKPSVHIETVNLSGHEHDDIIVSASGEQGFVSIDGKRTYLNLFDTTTSSVRPSRVQPPRQTVPPPTPSSLGQGVAVPADDVPPPPPRRPSSPHRPPQQGFRRPPPTVRIDTCIVGDDSTCDKAQNEKCRTEAGISSCQCRPGLARRSGRDPCRRVVSLLLNLRVDRIYDRKVAWDSKLSDKESEPYQQLSYEAVRAIDSAFSMTPFSDDFVSAAVNTVHRGDQHHSGVYVNFTILMQETAETIRPAITTDIQKHLLGAIRRRSNNIGSSVLWVDSVAGSVLPLHDVDECSSPDNNDCHQLATCTNTFGGFKCSCPPTTLDPRASLPGSEGRECKTCAASHCSERGQCLYSNGQPSCSCNRGYFGSRCEIDGEVIGAALGATLTAALVIGATLTALLSWSRKWSREQKAVGMGSPVFNYMASNTIKTPPVGQPPYQVTLEERMRWAQIAEAMVQANHYAPESQTMATRPSSAMFGAYPTLPPVPLPRMGLHGHHNATMNTVASRANTSASHHNLYGYTNQLAESSSSEASSQAQDRADLLVPRPKSRARSMHNQTGIYYDVEYENAEPLYGTKGIPLSTYTVSRGPPFYRA